MARATKAALASPNVVTLPTAAPRQVKQPRNKEARKKRQQLREGMPFRYISPGVRSAAYEATLLVEAQQTPAMALATAVFEALDPETKERARAILERMAHARSAQTAIALLKRRTVGDQHNLYNAMDLVRDGELSWP